MLEGKVLHRVLRCTPQGREMEADPRHAELIIEQLGLENAKIAATPGTDGKEEADVEGDVEFIGEEATNFRAVFARGNYLAMDRPNIQFSVKEICREMRRLVCLGRHLKAKPRLVWEFVTQDSTDEVRIFTDSDWAGCRRSRTSTSGGVIRVGSTPSRLGRRLRQ